MAKSFYTSHSGVFFVSPGGQSEPGPRAKAAGYDWACIDIADGHPFADWSTTVSQCNAAGMRVPVWGRVANSSLMSILGTAIQLRRACVLNIEDEFKVKPPAQFEAEIKALKAANPTYTREIVISTVGWLYGSEPAAPADIAFWKPIAHRPVLLQIFPQDMHRDPATLPDLTAACIQHAKNYGFRDIGVTFQTYGTAQPSWYTFWSGKPRSLFTGDQVGSQSAWQQWAVSA